MWADCLCDEDWIETECYYFEERDGELVQYDGEHIERGDGHPFWNTLKALNGDNYFDNYSKVNMQAKAKSH